MKSFRPHFPRINVIACEGEGTGNALAMRPAAVAQRLQEASKLTLIKPGESKLRSANHEYLENRLNTCLHG